MKFNSKLIHAGWDSDADAEGAITVPIYRTTAYQFNNTEHAASLFALKEFGNIYSRIGNPTVGALEARLTALLLEHQQLDSQFENKCFQTLLKQTN